MPEYDLDRFIDLWVYEVESVLRRELENLKSDMRTSDDAIQKRAEADASEILDWLLPPPAPITDLERQRKAQKALADEEIPQSERGTAAMRALRSTGRRKGRPRNETSQEAIRALTLHLATKKSWREIALQVRGCNHKRPNLQRSCAPCGDAIRDAAGRLEKFLRRKGYHPNFPRRTEVHLLAESEKSLLGKLNSG